MTTKAQAQMIRDGLEAIAASLEMHCERTVSIEKMEEFRQMWLAGRPAIIRQDGRKNQEGMNTHLDGVNEDDVIDYANAVFAFNAQPEVFR